MASRMLVLPRLLELPEISFTYKKLSRDLPIPSFLLKVVEGLVAVHMTCHSMACVPPDTVLSSKCSSED